MEFVMDALLEIIGIIVVVLVGIGVSWYKDTIKDDKVRAIIADGVLFAQQVYRHVDGEARFRYAKEEILYMLKEKGLKVSTNEVNVKIESVLKTLKSEYGTSWYEVLRD